MLLADLEREAEMLQSMRLS